MNSKSMLSSSGKKKEAILVTGASSYIGSKLITSLDFNQYNIFSIDVSSKENIYYCDIRSGDLENFIIDNDINIIIHLASMSSDGQCKGNSYDTFDINVMGTLNLIKCAKKSNSVRKIIFASTEWVYNENNYELIDEETPINSLRLKSEYALSKYVSECNFYQELFNSNISVNILRFGIVYSDRQAGGSAIESVAAKIFNGEDIKIGSLKTARKFIHRDDVVRAIICGINIPGFSMVNIQGPELVSLEMIINCCKMYFDKDCKVEELDAKSPSIRNISSDKIKALANFSPEVDYITGIKNMAKKWSKDCLSR